MPALQTAIHHILTAWSSSPWTGQNCGAIALSSYYWTATNVPISTLHHFRVVLNLFYIFWFLPFSKCQYSPFSSFAVHHFQQLEIYANPEPWRVPQSSSSPFCKSRLAWAILTFFHRLHPYSSFICSHLTTSCVLWCLMACLAIKVSRPACIRGKFVQPLKKVEL